MGLLSIGIGNDAIRFSREGKIVGMMPLEALSVEGLALFKQQNYDLQGSAGYQQFLEGALSGLTLAYGPPIPTSVEIPASEAEQADSQQPTSDLDLYVAAHPHKFGPDGEFVNDAPKELQSIDASEVGTVEEIIVPGHTVHDGVVVGTVEETTAVPVAGEAVGEATVGEEHAGLTPSRSPETAAETAKVASP